MTESSRSIRVLLMGALLVALLTIATPASADPGTTSALETLFSAGPPGEVSPTCDWWYTWC